MYTEYASARGVPLGKLLGAGSTVQAGAPPVGRQAPLFGNLEYAPARSKLTKRSQIRAVTLGAQKHSPPVNSFTVKQCQATKTAFSNSRKNVFRSCERALARGGSVVLQKAPLVRSARV